MPPQACRAAAAEFADHPAAEGYRSKQPVTQNAASSSAGYPTAVTHMSTITPPRISVVIPCYNGARFLDETIQSVLHQRYPATEIVVVDDGSTDRSLDILARYPDVRVLRQRNGGVAAARNTGLQYTTGEYVVFLDHD